MSAGPGWYPDPGNPSALRYYDGAAWTSHTASALPPAPGHQPAATQQPTSQQYPHQQYASQPYGWQPQGQHSGVAAATTPRWPFAVVGAGVVLAIAGVLTWGGLSQGWFDGADPGPSPTPPVTADPATDPTDPTPDPTSETTSEPTGPAGDDEVVEGTLVLDATTPVSVPAGAQVQSVVTFPADGIYLISAGSTDGSDAYLAMSTSRGALSFSDFYPLPAQSLGLTGEDAMIAGWFTAGEHTIAVSDYYGEAAELDVTVTSVGDAGAALAEAEAIPITVPEDGVWVGYLDLVEGESLEIDVRTTSGDDLTAAVLTVDGLIWDDDDRTDEVRRDVGGDFLDPYVATENMPGGRVVVMVGELDGAGGTAEVTAWIIR